MKIHIVKKGDTLFEISKKYNVELDKLIAANPQIADPDNIDVGSKVKIPSAVKPLPSSPVEYVHKHTVVQGDTLWKLTKAWNVPLKAVIDANPHIKNPSALLSGDTVYIPKMNPDGTIAGANLHNVDAGIPHGKKPTAPKEELLKPVVPEEVMPEVPVNPVLPPIQEPVKVEEPEKEKEKEIEPIKEKEPTKEMEPIKAEEPEKVAEKPAEAEPIAKPEVPKEAEKGVPLPSPVSPVAEKGDVGKPDVDPHDSYQPFSQLLQTPQTEAYPYSQHPFAQFNVPASEVSAQPSYQPSAPSYQPSAQQSYQPSAPLYQPSAPSYQPSVQPNVQVPMPPLMQPPAQPSEQTTGEIQSFPTTSTYSWQDTQLPQIPGMPGSYPEYPAQTGGAGQLGFSGYSGYPGVPGQYAAQQPEGFPYPSTVPSTGSFVPGGCGCGGSGITSALPYALNPWENNIPAVSDVGGGPVSPYGAPSISGVDGPQVPSYGTPTIGDLGGSQASLYGTSATSGLGGQQAPSFGTSTMSDIGDVSGAQAPSYGAPSLPGAGAAQALPYGAPAVPGFGGAQFSPYGVPSVPGLGGPQFPPCGAPYGFQPGIAAKPFLPGGYVYHPYPLGATSETLQAYATPYPAPGLYGADTLPGQTGRDDGETGQIGQLSVQSNAAEQQDSTQDVRKSSSRSTKGKGKTQKAILHAIASKLKERPEKLDPKENLPWINY